MTADYPMTHLRILIDLARDGASGPSREIYGYSYALLAVERFAIKQIVTAYRRKQACPDFDLWVQLLDVVSDLAIYIREDNPAQKHLRATAARTLRIIAKQIYEAEAARVREATGRGSFDQRTWAEAHYGKRIHRPKGD